MNDLPYRPCVGIALFNSKGEVWVGQRTDMTEPAWQMPQGGIDKGEDPRGRRLPRTGRRDRHRQCGGSGRNRRLAAYDLPPDLVREGLEGPLSGARNRSGSPSAFWAMIRKLTLNRSIIPNLTYGVGRPWPRCRTWRFPSSGTFMRLLPANSGRFRTRWTRSSPSAHPYRLCDERTTRWPERRFAGSTVI